MFTSLTHATLGCLGQTAVIKSMPEATVVCSYLYLLAMLVMITYIPYYDEDSDKEEEEEDVKKENQLCYKPVYSPKPAPQNSSPLQAPLACHSMNLKVSITCSYTARSNGRQPFKKTVRDFNHWYALTYPRTINDADHAAKPMPEVKEVKEEEQEGQEGEEDPEPFAAIDEAIDVENDYMDIDYDDMDVDDDDDDMSLDDDPMDVVDDMDVDDSIFSATNNQTSQGVCKPVPMDIDSSELLPPRAQSPPRPSSTIQSREPANPPPPPPPPPRRGVPVAVPPKDRDYPSITRPAAEPAEAITTTTTTTTAAGDASPTTNAKVVADSNVPKDDPPHLVINSNSYHSSSFCTINTNPKTTFDGTTSSTQ